MKNPLSRRARRLGLVATVGLATTVFTGGTARAAGSAASASLVGRTLTINGTNAADDIVVSRAPGNPNLVLVDFGNDGTIDQQFDHSTFDALDVSLGNGDDHFSADGVPMAQPSTIDGGNGNDTIVGTAGDDVINGGLGDDNIDAGAGTDTVIGGGGNDFADGGLGHDTASLGTGDDVFVWDPGEGSDDVNGGLGHDTLLFNGNGADETMTLSASGSRAVFFRQQGLVTMNLDAVEQLDLHALDGADTITVNDMTGTAMQVANIDLSAIAGSGVGDGKADLVTVNGTDNDDHVDVVADGSAVNVNGLQLETHITGSDAGDHLQVNTRGGNDQVSVDAGASSLIGVATDLGAGQV